ncbi:MAG TPA: hypothetical protein VNK23_17925 [Candidatus Dormibacteraeota bacterium]|nr:hypothetical protein [Candidatus Dormibacteraeota bacterium]
MRTPTHVATVVGLLAAGIVSVAAPAVAAPADKYLHVKVDDRANSGTVNVNVPLPLAEAILPAINNPELHDGKVSLHDAQMHGVDVRAILEALRNAPDNEFVTVRNKESDVRVAKSNGNIVVHVTDKNDPRQRVNVTVPIAVANAFFANAKNNQLDVEAALRALSDAGDVLLVTVQGPGQKVRVWVDSRSTQD